MQTAALNVLKEEFAMKYRIKFSKFGKMRFIGHLDLLNLFQRAIKRADIPISYSKGFNPHQLISFAIPLPIGMNGYGEYADLNIKDEIEPEYIIKKLNNVMPEGICIINARILDNNEKNCAAALCAADYETDLNYIKKDFNKTIESILFQKEINLEKKGRKKVRIVDIRPLIYDIKVSDTENRKLKFLIATGSKENLKPDLLLEYICKLLDVEYIPYKVNISRNELYRNENNKFVNLFL